MTAHRDFGVGRAIDGGDAPSFALTIRTVAPDEFRRSDKSDSAAARQQLCCLRFLATRRLGNDADDVLRPPDDPATFEPLLFDPSVLNASGPPGICSKATSIAACSESREVAVKRSSCAIVPPLRDPKILRGGPCATERSVARGSGLRLVKPEAMTTTVPIVEPILTSSSAVPQQPAQQGAISRLGPASGFVPAGWGLSGFGIRTARSRSRAGPQFHPGGLSRSRAVDPFSDRLPRQIRFHTATEPQLPQLGSRLPSK